MTRRLLVTYMAITAFALLVLELPLGLTFADRERDQLLADTERDARVIGSLVEDTLESGTGPDPRVVASDYAEGSDARVVITDAAGISLADTTDLDGPSRDFSSRDEVAIALEGGLAAGIRRSETLGADLLYVAVPVASSGVVHGAVRVTYPPSELDRRVRDNWLRLGALSIALLAATGAAGYLLAQGVVRPLGRVRAGAHALAGGDLAARVPDHDGPPEVRDLAAAFNEMAGRLEALVDGQRAFVADASHQLRTPLTALRLRLDALEAGVEDEATRAEVDAASAEAARLSRLVEGLLALARAEGAQVERRSVHVAEVARERAAIWAALAEERDVRLEVVAPDRAEAMAVDGAVEQILDNLIDNALDVAPAGSAIEVVVRPGDDEVLVAVRDRGRGMTAEEIEHAFDRFWRPPSSTPGGTGLGLAIVRQLAQASGGEAFVRARPGGGLEAGVELQPTPPTWRAGSVRA